MSKLVSLAPALALADLAQIYGAAVVDFEPLLPDLTHAWKVTGDAGETLGVLALRDTPTHGSEVMGGVVAGEQRETAALKLWQAALRVQPRLYAYADESYWTLEVFRQLGLTPYRAYRMFSGVIPDLSASLPAGFELIPLSEVPDLATRRQAQEGYADLIGHTLVTDEAIIPNAAGSDDTLGCLVFTALGETVGVCRVWKTEDGISLTVPAVLKDYRDQSLMQAMLSWVFEQAREQGLQQVTIESWGDDDGVLTALAKMGLERQVETRIYVSQAEPALPA